MGEARQIYLQQSLTIRRSSMAAVTAEDGGAILDPVRKYRQADYRAAR